MKNLPTIKQLRYFNALEEHGHFGQAAAACFVSQSAFSVAIREFESLVGAQLVERTNKRVTVTPVGHQVANQSRLVIRDIELLLEIARENAGSLCGPLTVGVIPTIAPFLLPKALPVIRESYPELKMYIREGQTADIFASLMGGKLDLCILALPYDLPNADILPLFRDRFFLAYNRDTKLIDPDKFSINRVTANTLLLLEDGHCMRDHAMAACKVQKTAAINQFAASSLFTLLEMVESDLGVTFVPEMAIESALIKQANIETQALADRSYREIGLAWRRGSARGDEFSALGELITQAVGQTPVS